MNENEILQKLILVCNTKADAVKRVRILKEFLENKFFKNKSLNLEKFLKSLKASEYDIEAMKQLPAQFYASFNKNNAYPIIRKISKALDKLETIHLYVPVELTEGELFKIGSWFKKNVAKNLTLGCALSRNGVYRDFSLKYFLQGKRPEINKILDNYVKT